MVPPSGSSSARRSSSWTPSRGRQLNATASGEATTPVPIQSPRVSSVPSNAGYPPGLRPAAGRSPGSSRPITASSQPPPALASAGAGTGGEHPPRGGGTGLRPATVPTRGGLRTVPEEPSGRRRGPAGGGGASHSGKKPGTAPSSSGGGSIYGQKLSIVSAPGAPQRARSKDAGTTAGRFRQFTRNTAARLSNQCEKKRGPTAVVPSSPSSSSAPKGARGGSTTGRRPTRSVAAAARAPSTTRKPPPLARRSRSRPGKTRMLAGARGGRPRSMTAAALQPCGTGSSGSSG